MRAALLLAVLGSLVSLAGCVVEPIDLNDRQCDDDHPCVDGYSCIEGECENDLDSGSSD